MTERDKEYYNQKISELYSVIENQDKIIKDLQEKINTYEDPEDLTLFYMWIDNKAKDKMKELQQRIDQAIEYVEKQIPIVKNEINIPNVNTATSELLNYEKVLEILKGGNNE